MKFDTRGCSIVALMFTVCLVIPSCKDEREPTEDRPTPSERTTRVMRADEEPCTITEPCAESAAAVTAISPQDPRFGQALLIDARPASQFSAWHLPEARNVVYDFLDATPRETVLEIAAMQAPLVVVYGDGDDPDSGEALARELAGAGVESVFFIEGGAPALQGGADSPPLENEQSE